MSAQRPAAFYAEWFKRTFSPAFKRTGLVNLAVGIGLGLVAWRWPTLGGLGTTLRWLLPLVAFASFFVYQWFRAPLEMMSEVQLKLSATEVRAQSAEEQVRETRDCQAIADFLTEQHEYGVHKILHMPPKNLQELSKWSRWVENWNSSILLKMEALQCTPQDLNHVRTISMCEVTSGLPGGDDGVWVGGGDLRQRMVDQLNRQAAQAARQLEIPIRMHAIRLTRVADVSTKYANRAEELKLAAAKRLLAT